MGSDRASSRSTVSDSKVAELEEQLAAAHDGATEARARADEAERRVLELESLAQDAPSIVGPPDGSASSGGSQEIELRSQLRDLESQLLQSEARARSAYAATEAAEAALRMAKEEGFIPSMHSEQEFRDLRTRLEDVTGRADQAERALAKAEADLAAHRAGVDPDALADPLAAVDPVHDAVEPVADPAPSDKEVAHASAASTPQDSDSWVAGSQPSRGLSFRKLAGAASGKKNRDGDPSGR